MSFRALTPQTASQLVELDRVTLGFITHVAWSPDGSMLAAAHGVGVVLWRGGFGGMPDLDIRDHQAPVKWVAFAPSSRILVTASSDTTVRLWNSMNGAPISTLRGQSTSVECAVFDTSGRLLGCGASDGSLCTYDFASSGEVTVLPAHAKDITSIDINGEGILASASWDNTAKLWNSPKVEEALTLQHPDWVRALTFTPEGSELLTACKDGSWRRWGVKDGELTQVEFGHDGGIDSIACSRDGALLATGGRDGVIRFWQTSTGAPLAQLTGHTKPILTLAFHPNGQFLVSGSGDNTLRLWGFHRE